MKKFILSVLLVLSVFTLFACKPEDENPVDDVIDTNLYTTATDALTMDFTYEGLEFIRDGIGEVTLEKCTDGDTATFRSGSNTFPVRFLGINTPESTYRIDPWGKAASAFTCDKLTNATTIVLEADGDREDGNDRYLAWVWYDGRLLNLELVEQAYTGTTGIVEKKYEDVMYNAELEVSPKDRRIWGELDPDFDYSLDGTQITIEELATHPELYEYQKVVVVGIVAAEVGIHPYLVDGSGYGIYMYLGYDNSYYVEPGNEIRVEGLNLSYFPDKETGSPQLIGFVKRNVELVSEGNVVTPRDLVVADIEVIDLGSYVRVQDITVTEIYLSPNTGDYTVTCQDAQGNEIGLHIQNVETTEFTLQLGDVLDVIGPLSRYMGQYQLELTSMNSVVIK